MTIKSFTGLVQSKDFETVSSKTGVTFTAGNSYTMQVQNDCYLKIADAVFRVSNEKFCYTAGSEDLYIKTPYGSCQLTILEND